MIVTVTLNPLLETHFVYQEVSLGKNNRNSRQFLSVGGKGINVNRQLNMLNVPNMAFTFLGGANGKLIQNLLKTEKIDFTSIRIKDENRTASVIFDESKKEKTTFFGITNTVSEKESVEFKVKLEKMIQNCEIVVFSGSSACKETDDIFPFGIGLANKFDKVSVLDTYGKHLLDCLDSSPTIVHNNVEEVTSSLGITLLSEDDKLNYLSKMYSKGIKQVFLTDEGNHTYASNFDFLFRIENPLIAKIDSTGSGDAFVSGIVYGLYNELTFENYLVLASSLGAANASRVDVCNVKLDDTEIYKEKIRINPIGKKMKLLDVTPQK